MNKLSSKRKKEIRSLIEVTPSIGESIDDVIEELVARATCYNTRTFCKFNDMLLVVNPEDTVDDVGERYYDAICGYSESAKTKRMHLLFQRELDEIRNKHMCIEKDNNYFIGLSPIMILAEEFDDWESIVIVNSDDDYSKSAVTYATAVASRVQVLVSQGYSVEEVFEKTTHDANFGMSGYQALWAINLLRKVWVYGNKIPKDI